MDFLWLKKINDYVMKFLSVFIAIIATVMVVVVFTNVVTRYVFRTTIPWSEELGRFLFIWVTFVGVVLANDKSEHMRLDFIVDQFKGKTAEVINILAYAIVIVLLTFLIHGSIRYTMTQWDWMSSALGVRHGIVYIVAPISFTLMAIQYFSRFIKSILDLINKKDVE